LEKIWLELSMNSIGGFREGQRYRYRRVLIIASRFLFLLPGLLLGCGGSDLKFPSQYSETVFMSNSNKIQRKGGTERSGEKKHGVARI